MTGLVLVLALGQYGPEPTVEPVEPLPALHFAPLKLGEAKLMDVRSVVKDQPSPGDGCWFSTPSCVAEAKGKVACERERDALRQEQTRARWWMVAAAFAVGAGAALAGATLFR